MFKNLSNRVSAKTIEETYTENDVEHVKDEHGKETTDISLNYIPNTGFTFDYPQRWLNEETDFKAIGIRRLKVVPTSHVFALNFVINYTKKSTNEDCELLLTVRETVIAENSLEEIISYDKRTNRYKVKFDDGKGGEYIDNIPVSNLRGRYPTRMSNMEKEFFEKQK